MRRARTSETPAVESLVAETWSTDVEGRAFAAIEALAASAETLKVPAIEAHLRTAHRIGVSHFWIAQRLQRLGWCRRRPLGSSETVWVRAEPRGPVDLDAADADPAPLPSLLEAAETVCDWAMKNHRLAETPFRELSAAVVAERGAK